SFLGRVFLTWFNPGSGTGYVFATINLVGAAVLTCVGLSLGWAWGEPHGAMRELTLSPQRPAGVSASYMHDFYASVGVAMFAPCYLIIYLGIGRLIIRFLRRYGEVNMFVGVVFHLGLLAAGSLLPLLIQYGIGMIEGYAFYNYSLLQVPSPIWTLVEVAEHP